MAFEQLAHDLGVRPIIKLFERAEGTTDNYMYALLDMMIATPQTESQTLYTSAVGSRHGINIES